MGDIIALTDNNIDSVLQNGNPVLLLFSNGDDLRGDFNTAFKKAAAEHNQLTFARIVPEENPQLAERFNVGSKSMLVGLYRGEELVRRNRPWGADVPLAIELLQKAAQADAPEPQIVPESNSNKKEKQIVENKPVAVTDQTFQQEVIDHDLPVVVDFWAEWCGPCRMVAPIFDKLAEEFAGKVRIAKVDVDANPGLSQAFQVMSIPTIMMFKQRNIVFNQAGALPEPALRDLFNQLVALEIPAENEEEVEEETTQ